MIKQRGLCQAMNFSDNLNINKCILSKSSFSSRYMPVLTNREASLSSIQSYTCITNTLNVHSAIYQHKNCRFYYLNKPLDKKPFIKSYRSSINDKYLSYIFSIHYMIEQKKISLASILEEFELLKAAFRLNLFNHILFVLKNIKNQKGFS